MKILLKKLTLVNFKGIRSFTVSFNHITNIYGDNAVGKTSLFDAFLWLLFGKDSTDRKDFEIKTLDENNQAYHRLDHEVEGVLVVDGHEITLRRGYREKWTKKRGSSSEEFTGHETTYYWNDVPMKQDEYQSKIASLIDEKIFKLITNTNYFNGLKWQDRRAVLLQLAGKIADIDVLDKIATLQNKDEVFALTNSLNQGKTMDEFKRQLSAQKKKIKDELDLLPARIQEANRALPEEKDYEAVESQIAQVKLDIEGVEGLLLNKSKAQKEHQDRITDLLKERQRLSNKILDIESGINNQVQAKKRERDSKIQNEKSELRRLQDELTVARREYSTADTRRKQLVDEQADLRKKWATIDGEKLEFKEGQFCCPACKREFEADDKATKKNELTRNFNTDKSNRLKDITDRGQAISVEIKDLDTKLENLKAKGETLNQEITVITKRISELDTENSRLSSDDAAEAEKLKQSSDDLQQCKKEVAALTEKIEAPATTEDNSALLQRKRELTTQLDQLKTDVASKGAREKQLARIEELTNQESAMNQQLARFEGIEYTIEQFTKAKMDMLEDRINGRFQIVRFKMFEEQINGGQTEACTTLINGVPYSDANTAAKIQAGLDIINVLNDHYDVQAPVWVDNRESVVRLPETGSQLISLIVSAKDKKLRVSTDSMVEEFA